MADTTPSPDPEEGPALPEHVSQVPPGAIEFLTLGIAWAVMVLAGGSIGYLIDGWLGTSPLFILVGLAFGVVSAVLLTVARVRKYL